MTTQEQRLTGARIKVLALWLALTPGLCAQTAPEATPQSAKVAGATDAWVTQTFDVKYVDPEQLREIFSQRSFVMEANRELKFITAHGTPGFLKEVADTVKRFDVAPPLPANIQITVYLLTVGPSGIALPPDLAAISKELRAAGSQALRVADSQMVRVRAGQPAETTGPPEASETVKLFRVGIQSASVAPGARGDAISLNGLRVWFNGPAGTGKTGADVSADVDVEQNQSVVVAKSGVESPQVVVVRASVVH